MAKKRDDDPVTPRPGSKKSPGTTGPAPGKKAPAPGRPRRASPPAGGANLPVTQLKPGGRTAVTFSPPEGTIQVSVSAVQAGLPPPKGKPTGDPDKPDIGVTQRQNVDVQASLFPPGASSGKSKTFKFRDVFNDPPQAPLELGVRPELAGRQWRCEFKNTGRTTAKVSGSVRVVPKSEPEPPPPAEVSIDSRASLPVTFLRPNDTATLPFKPAAGAIDVSVFATEVELERPKGKPSADPDKPDIGLKQPQNVTVGVELHTGGRTVASATFRSRDAINEPGGSVVRQVVTADLAGDVWECRVRNRSKEAIHCSAVVSFLDEGTQTELPLSVLNHGLRQLVAAIGLTVRIDGRRATIGVTPELQAFADESIGQSLDLGDALPTDVNDLNLYTFGVTARSVDGHGMLHTHTRFETAGEEISNDFVHFQWHVIPIPVDNVDIGRLAITVDVTLLTIGDPGRRSIVANSDVKVEAEAFAEIFEFFGIGQSDTLRDELVSAIRDVVASGAFNQAVRRYLTAGLVHLAQQGHEFVDLRADADAWIVVHRDPDPGKPPPPRQPRHVTFRRPRSVRPAPGGDAAGNLAKIERLVVLMMENRSFDHLLGYLSHPGHGLERLRRAGRDVPDGLTGEESNPLRPNSPGVRVAPYPDGDVNLFDGKPSVPATAVPFSPHHEHDHVLAQIGDGGEMDGFASDFVERFPRANPQLAMSFYTDRHLPVYAALAKRYAVCDRWFGSHPGPTQPNRFCTLSGHTPVLDNFPLGDPIYAYLRMPTIFEVLSEAGVDWAYFEGDVGFLRMYDRYRLEGRHVVGYDHPQNGFRRRAELGMLPPVTFIDPNFADIPPAATANDDHAPADLRLGQRFVAEVHDALRSSPDWVTDNGGTLLVVTYDEHGGFFDHVAPPGTARSEHPDPVPLVHPAGPTLYGPRVPTFAIGAFVRPGSVDHTLYDHTSIIATILRRFVGEFPAELGPRPALANHLGHVLELDEPQPSPTVGAVPMPQEIRGVRNMRPGPDDFHAAMRSLAQPHRS
jgi:phospholipase C